MKREPTRRAVLGATAAGATLALAGCTGSSDRPAGSLWLENSTDLPHSMTVRVTDVGTGPGESPRSVVGEPTVRPAQRRLSTQLTLDPDQTEVLESVFTEPVWYLVEFEVDGRAPATPNDVARFSPQPDGAVSPPGRFLKARLGPSGEFGWVVTGTDNLGEVLD